MKRRTILLGGLAGLIGLKVVSCSQPTATLRYRLRITGRAGSKPFSGGTIFECRWWDTRLVSGFDAMGDWERHTHGDAAIIDLGERGLLFGLWNTIYVPDSMNLPNGVGHSLRAGLDFSTLMPSAHRDRELNESKNGTIFSDMATLQGEVDISKFSWPIFARFGDIRDIKTVELVDPHDLEARYGPDSTIERITVELSRDPISRGIETRLPWWDQVKSHYWQQVYAGPVGQRPLYADLEANNFKADA